MERCYQIIHLHTHIAQKRKQSNAQMVWVKMMYVIRNLVSVLSVTLLYTVWSNTQLYFLYYWRIYLKFLPFNINFEKYACNSNQIQILNLDK